MALNRAQVALNLIRTMGTKAYKDSVPALTESTPIESVWNVFTSQPLVYKEFTQLFGAFLELEVMKDSWNNVLSELIISGTPLGEFSAVIGSNPATPHSYNPNNPAEVLNYAMSSDKVAYYVRNIREFFKVSFAYEDMKGAFRTYEKFDEYMSMKLATLESGKQISSYNHMMESIVINYFSGVFVESDIHIDETTTNYADWLTAVKNAYDNMQFPSTNFNRYGQLEGANGDFKAWSKPEDIYIIARIDWINKVDVSYLASVFNLDKAEVGKRIRKIPSFSYDTYDEKGNYIETVESPIQAMVIDRRAFKFKNDLDLDTSFFNDETLVSNYWKHFWATYQINPMAQALVFTSTAGTNTDQNTNFYDVEYNQPSVTTIKNTSNSSINITPSFDIELLGANGESVPESALEVEINDDDMSPDTVNDAVGMLALYLMKRLSTAKVGSNNAVALADYEETTVSLASGNSTTITISRTVNTNILKAGKYVYQEADVATETPEYSFIISDEMLDDIKSTYGNNIYMKVLMSQSGNPFTPVTTNIGFKNKI